MTDPKLVERAREIAVEVLIKSGLYQRAGVWPDDIEDSKCIRLVSQALQSHGDEVRRKLLENLKALDPLEAEGDFWEFGESDDIAMGVHKYLVDEIRKLLEVKGA